jgi:hypothetical protein
MTFFRTSGQEKAVPRRGEKWHSQPLNPAASLSARAAALESDSINSVDGVVSAIPSGCDAEIAQLSPAFQGPEDRFLCAVSRSLGDSDASNNRDLCMYVSVMVWVNDVNTNNHVCATTNNVHHTSQRRAHRRWLVQARAWKVVEPTTTAVF